MRFIATGMLAVVVALSTPSTGRAQNTGTIQPGAATPGGIVGYTLPQRPPAPYARPVVIGRPLPQTVPVYPVPGQSPYAYTVIGNRRVIVEPGTNRVVRVTQ